MAEDYSNGATMQSYSPTMRERLMALLMGQNKPSPERRRVAEGLTSMVPGISLQDAARSAQAGRYGEAAGHALNAMPVIAGPAKEASAALDVARQARALPATTGLAAWNARAAQLQKAQQLTDRAKESVGMDLSQMQRRLPGPEPATGEARQVQPMREPMAPVVAGTTAGLGAERQVLNQQAPTQSPLMPDYDAMGNVTQPAAQASPVPAQAAPATTDTSQFAQMDYVAPQAPQDPRPITQRPQVRTTAARIAGADQPVPMPTPRPRDLTPDQKTSMFSNLFNGKDYQSNSREVVDNGKLNWGDGDSSADFFRASKALQRDPTLSGYAGGGDVSPETIKSAIATLRRALGVS